MKKLFFTRTFLLLSFCATSAAAEQPNVVVILADDLGSGSLGCYGADPKLVRTPAIDRLAAEGMRFTDASAPSSVCSPTRYGLLMGRYPWRTRMKHGVLNVGDPLLPDPSRMSLARWLQQRGYRTAAIGKWHLGYGDGVRMTPGDWTGALRPGPLELGFGYHFGVPQNHGDVTGIFVENDRIFGLESDKIFPYSRSFYGAPYYGFDAPQRVNQSVMAELTDRAVTWLRAPSKQPFFLLFAPVAVHHPITPSDAMRGESGCGPYGDFIQDLDASVGRLLETFDTLGVAENTLVFFTSDNGGDIPAEPERPEGAAIALGLDINGAWRGDKHTIWEGGVRVPFIVRWPGRIAPGATPDTMISIVDIFATVAELVGGAAPADGETAPDSISFGGVLTGADADTAARMSMVVTNVQGIFALRRGPWKYIEGEFAETWPQEKRNTDFQGQAVRQLYHLEDDPAETHNVLDAHPEVAAALQAELDALRAKP